MSLTTYVLCGGRGSRMAPFIAPKALMPFKGLPLLWWVVKHVAPYVRDVVLCVGYRASDIASATKNWTLAPMRRSNAGVGASMCERLRKAGPPSPATVAHRPWLKTRGLVCYGDEVADLDLSRVVAVHERKRALMTVCMVPMKASVGIVELHKDGVTVAQVVEKPTLPINVNIGYVLAEAAAWRMMPKKGTLVDWVNAVAKRETVASYLHTGRRVTMNSFHELEEAEREW